jgi:putative flippase GtrA
VTLDNLCRDNVVAGIQGCGDGHASSQSTERREVTAAQHWENELPSEDFSLPTLAISNVRNDLRTRAAVSSGSNLNNSFACNELGECKRFADSEKAGARHKNPVRPSTLRRWLRFNFVGGIGIAVQFVALFLMKTVFHFNYLAATALAVEAAVVHNFVWHERFTWADRVQSSWRRSLTRLVRFNVTVGGVSILGNLALMRVMVGVGHMNYLLANAVAIGLCSLANFLVSEDWVFEER